MESLEKQQQILKQAICERIRNIRLGKGYSLDKLADETGLSKGYLSLIENGEKNPTISTLVKIAFGLNVPINTLLTGEPYEEEAPNLSLVRANERILITFPDGPRGYIYESLAHKKIDKSFDAYILTVGPELPEDPQVHEGEELLFTLEGRHEFTYNGQSMVVGPGDCLMFDSSLPHNTKSLDGRPAKVLLVTSKLRVKFSLGPT
jgi:transcriptional regulator with XRE-family HTH domain